MAFSRASKDDLLALKDNLQTDPRGLGYSPLFSFVEQLPKYPGVFRWEGDFQGLSNLLNTVGGQTIDPAIITTGDLQGAVDAIEFEVLTDRKATLWLSILQAATSNGISATNLNIRAQIGSVWGSGTTTRNNLGALQTRPATEMEVLFGEHVQCKPQYVGRALNQI